MVVMAVMVVMGAPREAPHRPGPYGVGEGRPGFPDLVLVRAPAVVFAELKTDAGKVGPEQRGWLGALKACEGVEARLWRPRDWPEIEEVLKR